MFATNIVATNMLCLCNLSARILFIFGFDIVVPTRWPQNFLSHSANKVFKLWRSWRTRSLWSIKYLWTTQKEISHAFHFSKLRQKFKQKESKSSRVGWKLHATGSADAQRRLFNHFILVVEIFRELLALFWSQSTFETFTFFTFTEYHT